MPLSDPVLWHRIERHTFDIPKVRKTWSAKLADEQGWSAADTERVAREYRRFIYLAQILEAPAAPPEPIDAAWRMHLLHTRSYWEDFVPTVLRGPFHRDAATVLDPAARKTFHRAGTAAYRREFDGPPPSDIWLRPDRMEWGSWVALLMIFGVGGGFLSFFAMLFLGWLVGQSPGGPVDSTIEKVGMTAFLLCWTAAFFSPLWAWLLTRGQKRLRADKRTGGRGLTSIGISFGNRVD